MKIILMIVTMFLSMQAFAFNNIEIEVFCENNSNVEPEIKKCERTQKDAKRKLSKFDVITLKYCFNNWKTDYVKVLDCAENYKDSPQQVIKLAENTNDEKDETFDINKKSYASILSTFSHVSYLSGKACKGKFDNVFDTIYQKISKHDDFDELISTLISTTKTFNNMIKSCN